MFTRNICFINGLLHLITGIYSLKGIYNAFFTSNDIFDFYYYNFTVENLAITAYCFDILVSFSNHKVLSRCRYVSDLYYHHIPVILLFVLTIPVRYNSDPINNCDNLVVFRLMQASVCFALISEFNESIMSFQYSRIFPTFFCSRIIMNIEYLIKIIYFACFALFSNLFYMVALLLSFIEGNFSILNCLRFGIFAIFCIVNYPKMFSNALNKFIEGPKIPYDCE